MGHDSAKQQIHQCPIRVTLIPLLQCDVSKRDDLEKRHFLVELNVGCDKHTKKRSSIEHQPSTSIFSLSMFQNY